MAVLDPAHPLTYTDRLNALRERKLAQTQEKQTLLGAMDHDDWGYIMPPADHREIIDAVSGSGEKIKDARLANVPIKSNHPGGGFFGPRLCGENFRALLDAQPTYIDPMCSLAGAVLSNFTSYRQVRWNPDFDYSHLKPAQEKYQLLPGIGGGQHFCPDLQIGFALGWGGLLAKIQRYRTEHAPRADAFYDGLVQVVWGMQDWIRRHADAAAAMAAEEAHPQLKAELQKLADINARLVTEPPQTFHEACQWMVWYLMAARMYNGSGALGRLDVLLTPFYEQDLAAGRLDDEEAIFHIACLLLRDTAYAQIGGPDATGRDVTNRVSYLILEAIDRLQIPANIGVSVGRQVDPGLLERGVEIQFKRKMGFPKFLGIDSSVRGMVANGYPESIGYERAYSGCHWNAIPGREYGLRDIIKVNFGVILDVALREMLSDPDTDPSVAALWQGFEHHLRQAIEVIAAGVHFHLDHMHAVFPELVLDLLCHGPLEQGLDASQGGMEFYNIGVDGAALALTADALAAIEQRVEKEQRLSWADLLHHLDTNFNAANGERVRLMLHSVPHYGSGNSAADAWAKRIAQTFTTTTAAQSNDRFKMTAGLFSWALNIRLGRDLGATANGRRAGTPISHGANPDPGFREDGATTAMAVAIAAVQPGLGNSAPMQLEVDPGLARDAADHSKIAQLIKTHFDLGGTQINMNVLDKAKVLEAHADPSKHPDLIVRVTGFSAYFASLSPAFRQLVVERIIAEG